MTDYDITLAFQKIEQELIASAIRNLDRHRAEETKLGIEWTQWQVEQLRYLEEYKAKNQKKYSKQFKSINIQIEEMICLARQTGNMEQEAEILRAIKKGFKGAAKASPAMSAQFFKLNDRKLETLIKATTDDMQKAEHAILRMANDKYRKVIFNAQVYANSGAGTYEKAVDMATKDMLSAGLNCVEYKNGARHTLADYADMAIRTANKRAYLQGEGEKRQEWGISTVMINKRGNPCPKCLPFVGKILIDDVWSGGKKSDGPYMLMSVAISRGLYHPRCKDSHSTYFEEISEPPDDRFTRNEINEIEKVNKEEARHQYINRQAEKYKRLADGSLDPQNKKMYEQRAQERHNRSDTLREVEFLPIRNWETTTMHTVHNIQEELDLLPENHQRILRDKGVEIEIIQNGASRFDPRSGIIYLLEDYEPFELVHETGHAIEEAVGVWEEPIFRALIEDISKSHPARSIMVDIDTFIKPINYIQDDRFISMYQGRVYDSYCEMVIDGFVNPDALGEYFSEGYSCYIENPALLESKDKKLFDYIKEMVK